MGVAAEAEVGGDGEGGAGEEDYALEGQSTNDVRTQVDWPIAVKLRSMRGKDADAEVIYVMVP